MNKARELALCRGERTSLAETTASANTLRRKDVGVCEEGSMAGAGR